MDTGARQGDSRHFLAEGRKPEDSENLAEPEVLALEIADSLEAALAEFTSIYEALAEPTGGEDGHAVE